MDYGEVITKSARLVWKFKILWLFGLLAGLGGGSGSPNPLNYNLADPFLRSSNFPQPFQPFIHGLTDMIRQTPGWFFFMLVALVCGLGLAFFLVGAFGRAGLIRGAWQADGGIDRLEFGRLVNESVPLFWRVAGLNLLVGLPGFALTLIFILFLVFGLVASFAQETPGIALALLCVGLPVICLVVPFFWIIGIWSELSTVAVVGEGRGIIDGLKRGWQLIRRYPGPVLLVGILVVVGQIGLGILAGLVIAPIGISALLGGLAFRDGGVFSLGFLLPLLLVALPLSLFMSAIFQSYIGTLWTLVFRRLVAAEAAQPPVVVPPPDVPAVPPGL